MEVSKLKTGRELLLISAPCKDDSDYEHIYMDACEHALEPVKKWFEENDVKVEYFVNWGTPWDSEFEDSIDFYLNYVGRIKEGQLSEEAEMIFKLKYDNVFPIKSLKEHIEKAFR